MSRGFASVLIAALIIGGAIAMILRLTATATLEPAVPLSPDPAPIRKYDVVAEYPHDAHVLEVSYFLIDYPFADRLFPHALDVIQMLKQRGQVVIVSDGDVVFQPLKIRRSGLSKAVDEHVLIYIHKEQETDDVQQRYPSEHYLMIDDKLHILAAMKKCCPKVTSVFIRQGHYAKDKDILKSAPRPDVSFDHIGDLLHYDVDKLISDFKA